MRLTQYSTFALRTLQFLALRAPAIVTVDDVARAHKVSRAHLVKVAYDLSQRGYSVRNPAKPTACSSRRRPPIPEEGDHLSDAERGVFGR